MAVDTPEGVAALKARLDANPQAVRDIINDLKMGTKQQKRVATVALQGETPEDAMFTLNQYFDNVRVTGNVNADYLAPREDRLGGRRRKTRRGRKVRRTRKSRR